MKISESLLLDLSNLFNSSLQLSNLDTCIQLIYAGLNPFFPDKDGRRPIDVFRKWPHYSDIMPVKILGLRESMQTAVNNELSLLKYKEFANNELTLKPIFLFERHNNSGSSVFIRKYLKTLAELGYKAIALEYAMDASHEMFVDSMNKEIKQWEDIPLATRQRVLSKPHTNLDLFELYNDIVNKYFFLGMLDTAREFGIDFEFVDPVCVDYHGYPGDNEELHAQLGNSGLCLNIAKLMKKHSGGVIVVSGEGHASGLLKLLDAHTPIANMLLYRPWCKKDINFEYNRPVADKLLRDIDPNEESLDFSTDVNAINKTLHEVEYNQSYILDKDRDNTDIGTISCEIQAETITRARELIGSIGSKHTMSLTPPIPDTNCHSLIFSSAWVKQLRKYNPEGLDFMCSELKIPKAIFSFD